MSHIAFGHVPYLNCAGNGGESILRSTAANASANICLKPKHIFIASPLPPAWLVPEMLWHILKAIICWKIWKNRNAHYLAGKPADAHRVIRKSWHRFGVYIRKEW